MTGALRRLARRSLPRTDGVLALACLERPVEVLRDRFGIPHVYAESRLDLVRAQGYVHAQDRLFQMETTRRFAFGRLSELAGPRTLELDRAARRLRLRANAERDAAACDPETAAVVAAYCEGVNAFIETGPRPFELRLARVRPERWTPVDVQAPAQLLSVALSGDWEHELARVRLATRVGDERARRLEPEYPVDHPVIVPAAAAARGLRLVARLRERLGAGASNSFVLAGSRSASGKPIVANDPHLLLAIPGIWHVQHVVWEGGECAGVTVAGAPLVVIGRTARVAWGLTTAMLDTQDLFVERFHPDDPLRYEADGGWAVADVVREEIRVRGRREPVVDYVVTTRHGPVVVPPEPGERRALALRWSAHEPGGRTLRALLDLMTAASVDDADRALDGFAAPPHNVLFADAEGSIAYRLAGGPVPIRAPGADGRLPEPGWDASRDWQGFIPPAELPRRRNPADGLLVTANNRIVGDDYRYPLTGPYLAGYRARRIESLLAGRDGVTLEACAEVLLDRLSLPGLELAAIARDFSSDDPLERTALDLLAAWDGELGPGSAGGAVYGALMDALEREAYAEVASDPLAPTQDDVVPGGFFERVRPTLLRMLAEREDAFFTDGRTWDGVFRHALAAAVDALGPDPGTWRRGRMHRLRLAHPFDGVRPLRRFVSRGPYEGGGDSDTVRVLSRTTRLPGAMVGASLRAVFDLADLDSNLVALVAGQSGHPASRHYDDLLPGWLAGEYVPLRMSRPGVEEVAHARLRLVPGPPPE